MLKARAISIHHYLLLPLFIVTMISMSAANAQANVNTSVSSDKHADTPLRFAKGQISTTVTGKLNPKQNEHWYQFSASSGQYAVINLAPLPSKNIGIPETANVGVLHMPNGAQDGTKGGIIYQGCLPVSGKYRLRIARNLMATQSKTAGYLAEVIVLPKYASQSLCQ